MELFLLYNKIIEVNYLDDGALHEKNGRSNCVSEHPDYGGICPVFLLLDAGQTDFARLSGVQTDGCLYGSYNRIVPSVVEQPGKGQTYCEFQMVQK